MIIWFIVLLAFTQGITEFFPVSSSGHLVLLQYLLSFEPPGITLEIALHIGTLLAILVFYFKDFLWLFGYKQHQVNWELSRPKLWIALILSLVPAVLVGLFADAFINSVFESATTTALMLIITGLILASTIFIKNQPKQLSIFLALIIGIAQAIAVIPGISRSGTTIVTGLWLGLKRETAAKFSFIMSVPAVIGAMGYDIMKGLDGSIDAPLLLLGVFISFLVGWISLKLLVNIVNRGKIYWFSPYCIIVGAILWMLIK